MSKMLHKIWNSFITHRKVTGYAGLLTCLIFSYLLMLDCIPDKIYVKYGEEPDFSFGVPVTEQVVDSEEVFATQQSGSEEDYRERIHMTVPETEKETQRSYQVVCRLFGAIPVKRISIEQVAERELIPAGTNIGIYVRNDAIMIIGTGEVKDCTGAAREPAKNVVQSGDYILAADGEEIDSKKDLIDKIAESEGKKIRLRLRRNGEEIEVSLQPVLSEAGGYQLGIWIRDDIAGVGTLTYVTDDMEYGALGHGITDADVGSLIEMEEGYIYKTTILGVRKGKKGQPGEMSGMINYHEQYRIGDIEENTEVGIYGLLKKMPEELDSVASVPVAYKQEIEKGTAQIISEVEGKREAFDIEIEQLDYHSEGDNKGIRFQVTDRRLLEDTGGIVQGMSGSPIMQNGRIIGAVTHVFIADSAQGYGIFIENMLER